MTQTHFTADTHFGHGLTTRPFATVDDHDEHLIEQINAHVMWNDRLFVLGDFCWRAGESYLRRIRCKHVHLLIGNHDKMSHARLFKTCEHAAEIRIDNQKLWLSHYAHAYWPASHRGSIHLYGHNHNAYEAILDTSFPGRRSMDACVENAFEIFGEWRPFAQQEIFDLMLPRPGHHPSPPWRKNDVHEPPAIAA